MKLPINYNKINQRTRAQVREQYIKLQENKCYWCKENIHGLPATEIMATPINLDLFPPNFLYHPIHLQHNHDTGMTEGAVHARCNAVLWQYYKR